MKAEQLEQERADFEAWAARAQYKMEKNSDGEYCWGSTIAAWEVWQARAQQQAASGVAVAYAVRSNIREVHQLLLRRQDADDYAAALLRAAPTHNPAITEVTVMPLYAAPTPTVPADVMADAGRVYTETEIADACIAADINDGLFESLMLELEAARSDAARAAEKGTA